MKGSGVPFRYDRSDAGLLQFDRTAVHVAISQTKYSEVPGPPFESKFDGPLRKLLYQSASRILEHYFPLQISELKLHPHQILFLLIENCNVQ